MYYLTVYTLFFVFFFTLYLLFKSVYWKKSGLIPEDSSER